MAHTLLADPGPPSRKDLLSNLSNFDIQTNQWSLSKGVLSKNSPGYHGDELLVVKSHVVRISNWYSFGCSLVNVRQQNDKLPTAGLVFGFVNNKNYWSVTIGTELSQPVVILSQVADGKLAFSTSIPGSFSAGLKKTTLRVEVHHQLWVKVYANDSQVLTHKISEEIAKGRIGLALQSGICGFSNVSIAGIAKR